MAVPKARPGSSWWRCQRHDQVVAVPKRHDQVRGFVLGQITGKECV